MLLEDTSCAVENYQSYKTVAILCKTERRVPKTRARRRGTVLPCVEPPPSSTPFISKLWIQITRGINEDAEQWAEDDQPVVSRTAPSSTVINLLRNRERNFIRSVIWANFLESLESFVPTWDPEFRTHKRAVVQGESMRGGLFYGDPCGRINNIINSAPKRGAA